MVIAYKLFAVADGVIVVFPEPVADLRDNIDIGYSSSDGQGYLCLGEKHLIPLKDDVLDIIVSAGKIHVGYSAQDEFLIITQGTITIGQLTLGKILAYAEIDKQRDGG